MRALIEIEIGDDMTEAAATDALVAVGARLVSGHVPVPMRPSPGVSASAVFSVDLPDAGVEARVRALPGVLGVFTDPQVGPND